MLLYSQEGAGRDARAGLWDARPPLTLHRESLPPSRPLGFWEFLSLFASPSLIFFFWGGVGVSSCSPFSPSLFLPLTFLLLFPFFSHFLGVGGFFGSFPRGTNTPKMHPSASRSPWIQPKSPCTTITPKPSRTTRLLPFRSKNSQWSLATIPAPRALSIYYIYKNKYINIKEGGFSLKTQCTGLEKSLEKPNGSR